MNIADGVYPINFT